MYQVEVQVPYLWATGKIEDWWEVAFRSDPTDEQFAQYHAAKSKAAIFRTYYHHVRVVKVDPFGTAHEVVRECPFSHAHTRRWCGYSECRES